MAFSDERSSNAAGIVSFRSSYSFDDSVHRLRAAFADRGIKIFATIDQQAEALAVGMSMPPTTLILFGNPKAGTPLMLANPQSGVDLPLKALVTESSAGEVDVVMNTATYIVQRYGLPVELLASLSPVERLVANVLNQ
jgi:uncharacterized protein (DUF302 family)